MTEAEALPLNWAGLMGLAGAIFLWGLIWMIRVRRFIGRSKRTKGTVLAVRSSWHHANGTVTQVHQPVFAYTDASGHSREGIARISAGHYNFPAGTQWPIRYDPGNPDTVMLDWFWSKHIFPVVLLGVGVLMITVFLAVRSEFLGG